MLWQYEPVFCKSYIEIKAPNMYTRQTNKKIKMYEEEKKGKRGTTSF